MGREWMRGMGENGENGYFQKALAAFTHDVASGGAIRHLADLGYTAREIKERLAFPAPYERVRETMREHLLDQKVLLEEEPGCGKEREQAEYVLEHDQYGRTSFRKVIRPDRTVRSTGSPGDVRAAGSVGTAGDARAAGRAGVAGTVHWEESCFDGGGAEEFAAFLKERCGENGQENAYVSCDFGLWCYRDPEDFEKMLDLLEERQRGYILGVFWVRKRVYHRLDGRMQKIVARLYGEDVYHGNCYFLKTAEKIRF